jgi:hypothetical protein
MVLLLQSIMEDQMTETETKSLVWLAIYGGTDLGNFLVSVICASHEIEAVVRREAEMHGYGTVFVKQYKLIGNRQCGEYVTNYVYGMECW